MRDSARQQGARRNWLRTYGPALGAYLLATWLTDAFFMGDTADYVAAIRAHEHGGLYAWDNPFWEFGHLLWRPLGWLSFHLLRPLTGLFVGRDERLNVLLAVMWINWLAGLACVLLLRRLLARVSRRAWVCDVVTVVFAAANGFLNYAQTGCSYVTGLAFLLAGLCLLARDVDHEPLNHRVEILAAASLAGAVCLWFPYVLVVPAAVALPLCLGQDTRRSSKTALRAVCVWAALTALAYGAVVVHLHLYDLARLKAWMTAAGHGYQGRGLTRMLFGLARSFINMGQDGVLFKRFLLHDPYSPVSPWQLFRASLWQLSLFYLTLAAMLLRLAHTQTGRRMLALLAAAATPVFVFALFIFEAGMPERYLPLYPFVFLALACALDGARARAPLKYLVLLFASVVVVSNLSAMSKLTFARRQQQVVARLGELLPRLKPGSLVLTVNGQDELTSFNQDFPFHTINRTGRLHVLNAMNPGMSWAVNWREDFAWQAVRTWQAGGDVWLSQRLFQPRPRPEWQWVEGADPRLSWVEMPRFFAQLETGETVGGDDGFVLLARTPLNEELLGRLAADAPAPAERIDGAKPQG